MKESEEKTLLVVLISSAVTVIVGIIAMSLVLFAFDGRAYFERDIPEWTTWSPWGACENDCGPGNSTRKRDCRGQISEFEVTYTDNDCEGNGKQLRYCDGTKCPIHGVWSSWSEPDPCPATCDGAITYQWRRCDSPPPSRGGDRCPGERVMALSCALRRCACEHSWKYSASSYYFEELMIFPASGVTHKGDCDNHNGRDVSNYWKSDDFVLPAQLTMTYCPAEPDDPVDYADVEAITIMSSRNGKFQDRGLKSFEVYFEGGAYHEPTLIFSEELVDPSSLECDSPFLTYKVSDPKVMKSAILNITGFYGMGAAVRYMWGHISPVTWDASWTEWTSERHVQGTLERRKCLAPNGEDSVLCEGKNYRLTPFNANPNMWNYTTTNVKDSHLYPIESIGVNECDVLVDPNSVRNYYLGNKVPNGEIILTANVLYEIGWTIEEIVVVSAMNGADRNFGLALYDIVLDGGEYTAPETVVTDASLEPPTAFGCASRYGVHPLNTGKRASIVKIVMKEHHGEGPGVRYVGVKVPTK